MDVVPGDDEDAPIRLIVMTTEGKRGFVDVSASGTNTSLGFDRERLITEKFAGENPRRKYRWSPEVWSAIERRALLIGMSAKQVQLSRGMPERIHRRRMANATVEQWVYPNDECIHFRNGKLAPVRE
jgi:hypothetical protein